MWLIMKENLKGGLNLMVLSLLSIIPTGVCGETKDAQRLGNIGGDEV
jgi:hypothetical protein